jgi:hypothetical protein
MPKPKLPDNIRRVTVFGRVTPPTKQFLGTIPEPNEGRAIDSLVDCVKTVKEAFKEAEHIPGRVVLERPELT